MADGLARIDEIIDGVARRAAELAPPPRGMPYLGIDHPSGSALALLEGLCRHGIFRKYEHVLDLGAELGATARWMTEQLGCTAIATAVSTEVARTARRLTRTAGLDDQVEHVAVDPGCLPFRDAGFTHVWIVEPLGRLGNLGDSVAEAYRVVRPGGHLAVQDLMATGNGREMLPGWSPIASDDWAALLTDVGFVDIACRDVSANAFETSPRVAAARAQLAAALERSAATAAAATMVATRATLSSALAAGDLRVVHVVARRP